MIGLSTSSCISVSCVSRCLRFLRNTCPCETTLYERSLCCFNTCASFQFCLCDVKSLMSTGEPSLIGGKPPAWLLLWYCVVLSFLSFSVRFHLSSVRPQSSCGMTDLADRCNSLCIGFVVVPAVIVFLYSNSASCGSGAG